MRLTLKIPLLFFAVLALALGFFAYREVGESRRRYMEATEDPLIDAAQALAAFIEQSATDDAIVSPATRAALQGISERSFSATVYQSTKTTVDLRIYVTSANGVVVFDSAQRSAEGQDYSRWRDVARTLRGAYGARSTEEDDPALGNVLYVAAPIRINGAIKGVVSIGKPKKSIDFFVRNAARSTYMLGLSVFLAGVALSSLLVAWVARPMHQLTTYARNVRDGRSTKLPQISSSDLRDLGTALEEMRVALEGKAYVERYVTSLTHELKSPLTGVRGAVELLRERDISPQDRARFLDNIERESLRMQTLIEKLLTLATIQRTGELVAVESIDLVELLTAETAASHTHGAASLDLLTPPAPVLISGNRLWLREAFINLIANAVEFSPPNGVVTVTLTVQDSRWRIAITDQGPGIPAWAKARVFDRFFSLPRPNTGKRSSGLGLTLVREIATAMNWSVTVEDALPHGTTVVLTGSLAAASEVRG